MRIRSEAVGAVELPAERGAVDFERSGVVWVAVDLAGSCCRIKASRDYCCKLKLVINLGKNHFKIVRSQCIFRMNIH